MLHPSDWLSSIKQLTTHMEYGQQSTIALGTEILFRKSVRPFLRKIGINLRQDAAMTIRCIPEGFVPSNRWAINNESRASLSLNVVSGLFPFKISSNLNLILFVYFFSSFTLQVLFVCIMVSRLVIFKDCWVCKWLTLSVIYISFAFSWAFVSFCLFCVSFILFSFVIIP